MNAKEELTTLRKRIDEIDGQLIPLFSERMDISLRIAEVKVQENMPIRNDLREQAVVDRAVSVADRELRSEVSLLMRTIIAFSREYQRSRVFSREMPLLPPPRTPVRQGVTCVFQGAWSEQSLIKLFPEALRMGVDFSEDVFLAVKRKQARYGIVAIENSQTGAIGETYDLLRKYGCFIVGRTWGDIRQCLIAPSGTALSDVREVFSHPQDFQQCSRFLRGRAWGLTACRDMATAAEAATNANNGRTAAIGSRRTAEVNGLAVLASDIMDSVDNRTSFVVIASEPEYDEKSDLISVTFSTAHWAGALCETLIPFMAQNINLRRIESRPSSSPESYRFFAELEGNILDANIRSTLKHAASTCEYFEVIGCYNNT
jgi:chorismate mutase/prephenate dehydratase